MEFLWLVFDDFEEGTGTQIDHVFFDCMLLMQLKNTILNQGVVMLYNLLFEKGIRITTIMMRCCQRQQKHHHHHNMVEILSTSALRKASSICFSVKMPLA